MPRWEWKCERCGAVKEWTMKSLEEADAVSRWCDNPDCKPAVPGGVCRMVRQHGVGGFVLKGDGFYVNDVKRKELRPIKPKDE